MMMMTTGNDSCDVGVDDDDDDDELSGEEIDALIQYFGVDSADTSESLVHGVKTLLGLARS